VVQISFIWIAFSLLPYSKKKGGTVILRPDQTQEEEDFEPCCCGTMKRYQGRGGRLRHFVYYDTITFFLVLAFVAAAAFLFHTSVLDEGFSQWQFKADLYWAKTIYGLLSIPFVVFRLPIVFTLLTHAKPTGYSENGKTVPLCKKKKKKPAEQNANSPPQKEEDKSQVDKNWVLMDPFE